MLIFFVCVLGWVQWVGGGGGGVSPALLSAGAVCVCIPFLVYLLPCLLTRLFVFFYFKFSLLQSVCPLFTQNTPYGVTIEIGSNLSNYISTDTSSWPTSITCKHGQLFCRKVKFKIEKLKKK